MAMKVQGGKFTPAQKFANAFTVTPSESQQALSAIAQMIQLAQKPEQVMFKLRMVASNQQLEQMVQTLRSISAKIHKAALDAQPDLPF